MPEASCQHLQCFRLLGKSKGLQKCNSKQGACFEILQMTIFFICFPYKNETEANKETNKKKKIQKSSCAFKSYRGVGTAILICCRWSPDDCATQGTRSKISHHFLSRAFISHLRPADGGREGSLPSPDGLRTALLKAGSKGNLPQCVNVNEV